MLREHFGAASMIAVGAVCGGEQHAGIDQKQGRLEVAGGHTRGLLRSDLTMSSAKIAASGRARPDERGERIVSLCRELRSELSDHGVDLDATAGGFGFDAGKQLGIEFDGHRHVPSVGPVRGHRGRHGARRAQTTSRMA